MNCLSDRNLLESRSISRVAGLTPTPESARVSVGRDADIAALGTKAVALAASVVMVDMWRFLVKLDCINDRESNEPWQK